MSSRVYHRWLGTLLLVAALVVVDLSALAASEEVIGWIEQHAIPLSSTLVGQDLSDLEPLRDLIGDARVVGLGEQTHGTKEFTSMKNRIIQFLVQEMGFTVLALETSLGGGLLADLYAQGGRVSLSQAKMSLEQSFFGSDSFGRLLMWMLYHNKEAETPIRVIGVDTFSPHKALEWFAKIAPRTGLMDPAVMNSIQYELPAKSRLSYSSESEDRWEYIEFVDDLVQEVDSISEELADVLGPWEMAAVRRMPRAVELLRGAYGLTSTELNSAGWWVPESWNYRDASMAENVAWCLDALGPDAKIVVWAHNGHIAKQWHEAETVPMGENLAAQFADDYVSIGFSTCQGTFAAYRPDQSGWGSLPVPMPEPESYDEVLCAVGARNYLLDLRSLPAGTAIWDWMYESRGFKTIGAAPDVLDGQVTSAYDIDATLPAMFDILVHITSTRATRINW